MKDVFKAIFINYFFSIVIPNTKVTTTKVTKMKKIILAISAAPAAIPVKPNKAAIIATIKKIKAHLSIKKFLISIPYTNLPPVK